MNNTLQTQNHHNCFAFGKNWSHFLKYVDEAKILEAENSLKSNLGIKTLKGKTFLDIGSGSGLFSLAAHRLGAIVYSFDYDNDSVRCTKYLKDTYGDTSKAWTIEQGSVLDQDFLRKFNKVDVLYSWGVLHHTGDMYQAFENVSSLVKPGGKLFISIYNDQGGASKRWLWIKKQYLKPYFFTRSLLTVYALLRQWGITYVKDFILRGNPFFSWSRYGTNNRGMSAWHDVVDWVGGYPFEVAKPEQVFYFFKNKGYSLKELKTCAGGLGCNEFIFERR
jgi:2-polyprenyl-3-methyl-5-hydroxy-6-metoxy-1,4-benzoquinol methylase